MFDALYILFEGRNINRNMTLKNHLKSVKAQKSETMQSYFTRVAQIKEQLEAIGDMVEEEEIVMTTWTVFQEIGKPLFEKYFQEEG